MINLFALFAASAAVALLAAPASAQERPRGEAKLAEMLEGRVAGEPRSCIRMLGNDNLSIVHGAALVSDQGNTIWVNRTANPRTLDVNDVMIIRKASASSLCRLDQITTSSRTGNFFTGVIILEDFVPYRRAD